MSSAGIVVESPTEGYDLDAETIGRFRRDGFVKLGGVLAPMALAFFGEEVTRKVFELNTEELPIEERTAFRAAFLQVFNLWTQSEVAKDLIFSPRLARIATELMGVRGVRLYHDQALYKEPGGKSTPWHADQYYWPLDTPNTVCVDPVSRRSARDGAALLQRRQSLTRGRTRSSYQRGIGAFDRRGSS